MSKKLGRPTKYTPELAKQICNVVASIPCSLKKMNEIHDFFPDPSTIHAWRNEYPDFSNMYARAKLQQADILAEQCLEIADDCDSNNYAKARLQIDTRKWLASKLLPKQYGDKYILDQKSEEDDKLNEEIRQLRKNLDAKNRKDY